MDTRIPITAGPRLTALALAALAVAVLPGHAARAQAGVISSSDIADTFTGSPYSQINQGQSPAINNGGQVLFDALTGGNTVEHLYVTKPTGGMTDIANTVVGSPHASFGGGLSLNNAGMAAYASGLRSGSGYGAYTGNGVTQTKIADSTSGTVQSQVTGNPVIAESGAVAFMGYGVPGSAGHPALIVAQNGAFTPVVVGNSGQFEYVNSHTLNSAGQVAFNTDDYSTGSLNGAFVYRYDPVTHVNTKLARAFTQTSVSINEAGVVAYEGAPVGGSGNPIGIFTNNGTTITAISRAGQALPGTSIVINSYGADPSGVCINNVGQVAFLAGNAAGVAGIYLGDGVTTTRIAQIGDVFQGHTIFALRLGQDALNDFGQVVYRADFTDQTAAIIRASTPAPEPSQTAALALGALSLCGLALRARRSQKGTRA